MKISTLGITVLTEIKDCVIEKLSVGNASEPIFHLWTRQGVDLCFTEKQFSQLLETMQQFLKLTHSVYQGGNKELSASDINQALLNGSLGIGVNGQVYIDHRKSMRNDCHLINCYECGGCEGLKSSICDRLRRGEKISAIKIHREETPGLGLKDAKDIVDEWTKVWENKYGLINRVQPMSRHVNQLERECIRIIRDAGPISSVGFSFGAISRAFEVGYLFKQHAHVVSEYTEWWKSLSNEDKTFYINPEDILGEGF